MTKELKVTTKYKKDLKAYKHKPDILQELNKVIDILLSGGTLPEKYKNHTLGGNLKDINDCHVKPNDVLLYKINETEVTLVRFGPHNKLELTENNKKDVNIMKLYMREINQEDFDVMSLLKDIPEEDIDHYETDLYLCKTPEVTTKVINKLPDTYKKNVTTFRDQIDHDIWYEIPFVFPKQVNRKGVKESLDLDAKRYLHVLIGQLQSELMKDNNFEYVDIDYDDKYVIIELILKGTDDNEYIARVPFTELHLGKFNKIEDDIQWILDKYTYINEYVITEDEDEIETWDVSFWDAEEMETYDLKTVRMTKDEVKKYVDKLNAKRTEREKENGCFYDYVLA